MRPDANDPRLWLAWCGMETDLIFNHGIDLPGFASFPLLDSEDGRQGLTGYYRDLVALGQETGCGVILDTPTWVANPDRGAGIGWSPEDLDRINAEAVRFAKAFAGDGICISAQVGPRGDGYVAGMASADAAQSYHARQIDIVANEGVDLLSAFTLGSVEEATGIIRAAVTADVPVVVSFSVETDGKLANGMPLAQAIARTDDATGGAASSYLVNCAHPDHIEPAMAGGSIDRLGGIVANASRQSHAELDEAEVLDDGDPAELGAQLADFRWRFPTINVLGGCCGTDMRHMRAIARAATR